MIVDITKEEKVLELVDTGEIEIDEQGRIWRLKKRHGRGVAVGGGYEKGARTSPCPRVRAEFENGQGYLELASMRNGKKTTVMAHRLVWVYLHGSIPEGLTINHINGMKDDNRPQNLELATQSEQRRHALEVLNVKRHHPKGSRHPKTRLTEADVLRIRELRCRGVMAKDIAADYHMRPNTVTQICTRRTWTHI